MKQSEGKKKKKVLLIMKTLASNPFVFHAKRGLEKNTNPICPE